MIGKIVCFVCAIASPMSVSAQGFPNQGTANFTDYATIVAPKTMTMGKDSSVTNYEVYGVSRNDDGNEIFNNMAIHCMGSIITANSQAVSRGLCVQSDRDGDQLFINYESGGRSAGARTLRRNRAFCRRNWQVRRDYRAGRVHAASSKGAGQFGHDHSAAPCKLDEAIARTRPPLNGASVLHDRSLTIGGAMQRVRSITVTS